MVDADRNKFELNRKDIAHQQFRLKNRFENVVSIGVKQQSQQEYHSY
jgi:hypothetical protein